MAVDFTVRPVRQYGRMYRVPLLTTAATPLGGVVVGGRNTLLEIAGVVEVTTAATAVTLVASYTDPDGVPQNLEVLAAVSEPVGITGFRGGPILAAGGTAVSVVATAGTANQAQVSVALRGA